MKSKIGVVSWALVLITVCGPRPCAGEERRADKEPFGISFSDMFRCDQSGFVAISNAWGGGWLTLSGKDVEGMRKAAEQFLKSPPPFYVGYMGMSDTSSLIAQVNVGSTARGCCIRGDHYPREVEILLNASLDAIEASQDKANPSQLLSAAIEHMRAWIKQEKGRETTRDRVTIENGEADFVLNGIRKVSIYSPDGRIGRRSEAYSALAHLQGASPGKLFFDWYTSNAGYSPLDRQFLLEMSLVGGEAEAIPTLRDLDAQQVVDPIETLRIIQEVLSPAAQRSVTSHIGESKLRGIMATRALQWLATNRSKLVFDSITHTYSIKDEG